MGLRLLALACLVGAAFAGPFQKEYKPHCAKQCHPPTHPKLGYKAGMTYTYEWSSENNVTTSGRQHDTATIEGTAEFHVLTLCEGVLKMRNVRIQQKLSPEEKQELIRKIELPLTYVYVDGKFENVCPSSKESTHSLNIKKGVISGLVNYMSDLDTPEEVDEIDSLGTCRTKYTVSHNQGLDIKKVKDLKTCTNRHTYITSFITDKFPSSLLFKSDYLECNQHIDNGIIKKVQCREGQKLKQPLKDRNSIFEFSGQLSLEFREAKPVKNIEMQKSETQESILYNIEVQRSGDDNEREVERILRELCPKNIGVVDIAASGNYMKLVYLVKSLSYEQIDKIYSSLKNGRLCSSKKVRDIFVDTLPVCGTDAAVKFMVKLLENKDITGLKAKLWPASFALLMKPTKDTVAAILPLVKTDTSAATMLGVSAMIHRFCSTSDCDSVSSVKDVVSILNEYLGSGCSSDDDDKVLTALKAFGNMGYHGHAHKNIVACAQESSKPIRLRLAAIDSFRRMSTKRPDEFVQMYSNTDEDYEVRIALFSSIAKHADAEQLRKMKRTAESETDEQVSGYVSSYIRNLNKTSTPLKQKSRHLLQNLKIEPPKVSYWENSKNIELSGFSKTLNSGGAIEADIIHSPGSKIPRSVYTRFDVDVFDKSLSLLEFNVRAEGLEDLVKKIIGLKDKVPESPTLKRDKLRSFNFLSAKEVFGESGAEASMFIRTLETELLDLSASDLSGIGEMVHIAELMNKLSSGKDADFSHSFVFMNTKLVIPSVTGRSYSIGLTGSSTVGLTAKSKVDVLNLPRNADVHLHFQPSANVEVSTTVGIQSNTHRPDMKVVSRIHLESDVEAKFQVKDGHVALASLNMPSENILVAKLSTDVLQIDADHSERRLFERRQKKIDYCFTQLEKPLGISACAMLEVPKPLITKRFPYVTPVGNAEFSLKKSDDSFSSYELRVEIPKHPGRMMKYKASIDTPGSRISRRFAAELDIKQHEGESKLSLHLTSPFKSAGCSASYTRNEKLVKGSLELHTSSKRLLTANLTTDIAASRVRKVYQTSAEVTYLDRKPLRIDGTVTVIKGRKHHLAIDLKTNKPERDPVTLKGTIMKEGRIDLSPRSEWKLSSELSLRSPYGEAQLRKTLEKRSKQSQTFSVSLGVEYQMRRAQRKQSVTFTSTTQRSSGGKMNTNAQFEMSQFPQTNWHLSWDKQGELSDSLKNDLTLKYGRNPSSSYLRVKQMHRSVKEGPSMCSLAVECPALHLDSELTLTHELQLSDTPKIHAGADLRYKGDKHLKGVLEVNVESQSPIKASSKLEVEFPGKRCVYTDKIEETSTNNIEGKSSVQCEGLKVAEFKYKYQKLSNDSKMHHEFESSLQLPSFRSPITSKGSFQLSEESFAITSEIGSKYSLQARLNRDDDLELSVKAPKVVGDLKVSNGILKKSLDLDLKLKTRRPRHIIATTQAELGDKKNLLLKIVPDADRDPNTMLSFSSKVEISRRMSGNTFVSSTRFICGELLDVSVGETGDVKIGGNYECSVEISAQDFEHISLSYKQEVDEGRAKSSFKYGKNHVWKAEIELEGTINERGNEREISGKASAISPDRSFHDMDVQMLHKVSRSGSSKILQSHAIFKKNEKVYKAEWNSDLQPNGMEVKALMRTPHSKYEKQAVGLSFLRSRSGVSSSLSLEIPGNQIVSVSTEIKNKNHGFSATCTLKSPVDIVGDIKTNLAVFNDPTKKTIEAYIDVNSVRVSDLQISKSSSSRGTKMDGKLKFSNIPRSHVQGIHVQYDHSRSSMSVSGKIELVNNKEILLISEIKEESARISTTTTLVTPFKSLKDAKVHLSVENRSNRRNLLFYIDANGERKGDAEATVITSSKSIEIQGRLKTVRTPEISAHLKIEKTGESFLASANVLKGTTPLLSTSLSSEYSRTGGKLLLKTQSFEKNIWDMEISKDVSRDESIKYNMKLRGPFSPVSLSVSTSRKEKNSLSSEIRACSEAQRTVCYSLKSYHKALLNSENYRLYQKVTLDLEKSVDRSSTEALGSLHYVLSASEKDYRSKVIVQVKEDTVGYEVKVHRREHERDHCSLDCYVFLPQQTSRARASILHDSTRVVVEAEAIPNVGAPHRKASFELKKEIDPLSKEVSGYVKMSHPGMSRPALFTCQMKEVENMLVRGKFVLRYSSDEDKTLTAEIVPNMENDSTGMRTMDYKIYTNDKTIDACFKLMRKSSRSENRVGYEWSYYSRDGYKKGGATITLSKKKPGKLISLAYFTPSVDYEIQGIANAPEDASLSFFSHERKIKEIRVTTSESCLNLEVSRSGPYLTGSLCVNKHEGNKVHLLKADLEYRQHKCVDARVTLDPDSPEFVDVVMEWENDDITQALKDVLGLSDLLHDRSLEELEQEFKIGFSKAYGSFWDIVKNVVDKGKGLYEKGKEYVKKGKKILDKGKEIWDYGKSIYDKIMKTSSQMLSEQLEKYGSIWGKLLDFLPKAKKVWDFAKDIYNKIKHSQMMSDHLAKISSLKDSILSWIRSLIPWSYFQNQVLNPVKQTVACFVDHYSKVVMKQIPDVGKLVWEATKTQFEHCLKKYCTSGTFCHELVRTYERHGMKETKELIRRKIDSLIPILKLRMISPIGIFNWVKDKISALKERVKGIVGGFMYNVIIRKIKMYMHTLEERVRQKAVEIIDKVLSKIHDIFGQDEDFKTAETLLINAKNRLVDTWRNKEKIAENTLRPMEENIKLNIRKMVQEQIQVQKFDLKHGEIRLRVRQPFGPSEIEILKNELLNMKRKLEQYAEA